MTAEESKLAFRISVKGMTVNFLLFLFKGIAGLFIGSVSLLSDAIHSLTDIFSTLVVLIGLKIASKPADSSHPYGHDKIECVIAFFLGLMLFGIGAAIGWEGYLKLIFPSEANNRIFYLDLIALCSALISIAAKEWMYRFTIKCAKKIGSASMNADAWHHRSDAISSIGSSAGVIGLFFGFPLVDIIACFLISVFIFKAAFDICDDALKRMVDACGDLELTNEIKDVIICDSDVIHLDDMKTRQFGSKLYVDLEVTLDRALSFEHSHEIAHRLENNIEGGFTEVKHCMVHVNPS